MTKGSNQLKISFMPCRWAIKSYKGRFMQFPDISKKKTRKWKVGCSNQLQCQTLGYRCVCHGSSDVPYYRRCATQKNPHSMATSAVQRSKFTALHREWSRLQLIENSQVGRKTSKKQKKVVL